MTKGIYVHSKACIYSLYLFTKQIPELYRLFNKVEESLMFLEKKDVTDYPQQNEPIHPHKTLSNKKSQPKVAKCPNNNNKSKKRGRFSES